MKTVKGILSDLVGLFLVVVIAYERAFRICSFSSAFDWVYLIYLSVAPVAFVFSLLVQDWGTLFIWLLASIVGFFYASSQS